jgi:hypothetical protein
MAINVKIDHGDESSDPVLAVLKRLAEVDDEFDFRGMVRQWQRRGALTPRQMGLVAWRLKVHEIEHEPGDFRVVSDSEQDRAALLEMSDWKRAQLSPYLSAMQRREFGT